MKPMGKEKSNDDDDDVNVQQNYLSEGKFLLKPFEENKEIPLDIMKRAEEIDSKKEKDGNTLYSTIHLHTVEENIRERYSKKRKTLYNNENDNEKVSFSDASNYVNRNPIDNENIYMKDLGPINRRQNIHYLGGNKNNIYEAGQHTLNLNNKGKLKDEPENRERYSLKMQNSSYEPFVLSNIKNETTFNGSTKQGFNSTGNQRLLVKNCHTNKGLLFHKPLYDKKTKSPSQNEYGLSSSDYYIYNIKNQERTTYEDAKTLHALWNVYVDELLELTNSEGLTLRIINELELNGAYLEIHKSYCATYIGLKGIVLLETLNAFRIVTPENKIVTILKNKTVFILCIKGNSYYLHGVQLKRDPALKSVKKYSCLQKR